MAPEEQEATPVEEIDALVDRLAAGDIQLDEQSVTENLVVDGDTANRILKTVDGPDKIIVWAGHVSEDWQLPETIEADLDILGSVGGYLAIWGSVGGHLAIGGSVGGDLTIGGSVGGYLTIWGSVGGDLAIWGSVGGYLAIRGSVGGYLAIWGSVGGYLDIWGSVGGDLAISGSVGGDLAISGSVGGYLTIWGSVGGKGVLTPSEVLQLRSVSGARFGAEVYIGDRVRIDSCDFRQCPDLDKLLLVGTNLFPKPAVWSVDRWRGPRLAKPAKATDAEMASVYRRLRTNLEKRSNRPGAAIFYRGEMRSRFWAALKAGRLPEAVVIGLYWLMSGFGLNPWRPVLFFTALAAVAAEGFLGDGALGAVTDVEWIDVFQFSIRSMVSFVSPPNPPAGGVLDRNELWLQLLLRFLGPLLFAQFVLAVRDRVAR